MEKTLQMMQWDDHHFIPHHTSRKNCDDHIQSDDLRAPDLELFAFYKDESALISSRDPLDEAEILSDSLHATACEPTPFRAGTHLQPLAGSKNKTVLFVPQEKNKTTVPATNASMEKIVLLQEFSQDDDEEDSSSSLRSSETQELNKEVSKCFLSQEIRWEEHFQTLLQYKQEHGNCHVPQNYPENPALARWVRRQRHQYKLKQQNKKSSMSDKRQRLMEEAGFTWDPQTDCWEIRRQELEEYLTEHGHCNVPSRYSKNPQLATWVKRQRRQYTQFLEEGRASRFHKERFAILCKMGFVWKARPGTKAIKRKV